MLKHVTCYIEHNKIEFVTFLPKMNLQSSQIKLLHPILNVFSCQILYCHEATIVTAKSSEKRLLVVATPGIFVIHQRSFPKTISVKEILPFSQVASIMVKRDMVSISGPNYTLCFQHVDQLNIATRIVNTRCALFHPELYPLNLHIANSLLDEFKNQNFDYTTDSLLADRFLSCCLTIQQSLTTEKIQQSYTYLASIKEKLIINNELTSLPYLKGVISALSCEPSITEIIIVDDLGTPKNYKLLCIMIESNPSLRKITFKNITIEGNKQFLTEFLEALKKAKGTIDEWVFDHCNFKHDEFRPFLECFREYKINIKSLIFTNCQFSESTFQYFTERFFFMNCFHSLESLWLSDINFSSQVSVFLSQLFASDWVLKDHKLKNLVIPKCCVELDDLFTQMQKFETGIMTADFSANIFFKDPPIEMATNLSPQINFIFSQCGFVDNTFSSLMMALAAHKGQSMILDISYVHVSNDSWKHFSTIAGSLSFISLVKLVWDGNPINRSFCDFISKQPRLKKLSISDCIKVEESSELLPELTSLFQKKQLDMLVIRASKKEFSLGSALIQCVMPLLKSRLLAYLDITGQQVMDNGVITILDNMPMVMNTFYFDGNDIGSSENMIRILNSILKKHSLLKSSWPESDVEKCLTRTDPLSRSEVHTRLDVIKHQFDGKFGSNDNKIQTDPLQILHNYSTLFKEHDSSRRPAKISWGIDAKPVPANQMILFRVPDDSLTELLKECNSLAGKDPMATLVTCFDNETTLEKLATGLQSKMNPDTLLIPPN